MANNNGTILLISVIAILLIWWLCTRHSTKNKIKEGFAVNDPNAFIWNARYKFLPGPIFYNTPTSSDLPYCRKCNIPLTKTFYKNKFKGLRCSNCGWDPTADLYGRVFAGSPESFIRFKQRDYQPDPNTENFTYGPSPSKFRFKRNKPPISGWNVKLPVWDLKPYDQGYDPLDFDGCKDSWDCNNQEVCFAGQCVASGFSKFRA